jgi:predicted heme/steroid binding protein
VNKKIIIGLTVAGAVGLLALFVVLFTGDSESSTNNQSTKSATTEQSSDTNTVETKSELKTFTVSDVSSHGSKTDCWTIINGNVYDITEYIPRHQGGDEILAACGKDGTSLFTERKTEDGDSVGSGTPHSSAAESQLKSLQIGTLSE